MHGGGGGDGGCFRLSLLPLPLSSLFLSSHLCSRAARLKQTASSQPCTQSPSPACDTSILVFNTTHRMPHVLFHKTKSGRPKGDPARRLSSPSSTSAVFPASMADSDAQSQLPAPPRCRGVCRETQSSLAANPSFSLSPSQSLACAHL